jgi:hypothetical protein
VNVIDEQGQCPISSSGCSAIAVAAHSPTVEPKVAFL